VPTNQSPLLWQCHHRNQLTLNTPHGRDPQQLTPTATSAMTMSLSGVTVPQSPISSGYRSTTPSPSMSHRSVPARTPLTIVPSSASLSRSPVTLTLQQQHHVRSQSLPSFPDQLAKCLEFQPTSGAVTRDIGHSSAVTILAQRRETFLNSQTYVAYIPKSPRLMPLMSPGAVTPMQLEDDVDYRFPNLTTAIRHSPLVAPLTIAASLEDEETELEQPVELSKRSR
jgi:hypothetical protein